MFDKLEPDEPPRDPIIPEVSPVVPRVLPVRLPIVPRPEVPRAALLLELVPPPLAPKFTWGRFIPNG